MDKHIDLDFEERKRLAKILKSDTPPGSDGLELYSRVYQNLVERRERVLEGKFNSIPIPFARFSKELPGIEQKTIYHVTANTKVN